VIYDGPHEDYAAAAEAARRLRMMRLARMMPAAEAELAAAMDMDDGRGVERVNARLREADMIRARLGMTSRSRTDGRVAREVLEHRAELARSRAEQDMIDDWVDGHLPVHRGMP
jgi:hypothetical protein